jgi:hypothetical protein
MNVFLFRDLAAETFATLRGEFPKLEFRQSTRLDDLASAIAWANVIFGNPPAERLVKSPTLRCEVMISSNE